MLDAEDLKVLATEPCGKGPVANAWSPDRSVTGANAVAVVDMAKLGVVEQLKAGTQPTGLIVR